MRHCDTGKVAPKFYEDLLEGYQLRQIAQSDPDAITREMAEDMLKKAERFVSMAEDFLRGEGGESERQ